MRIFQFISLPVHYDMVSFNKFYYMYTNQFFAAFGFPLLYPLPFELFRVEFTLDLLKPFLTIDQIKSAGGLPDKPGRLVILVTGCDEFGGSNRACRKHFKGGKCRRKKNTYLSHAISYEGETEPRLFLPVISA